MGTLFVGCRTNVGVSPGIDRMPGYDATAYPDGVYPYFSPSPYPNNDARFDYGGNPIINDQGPGSDILGMGQSVYDGVYGGEVMPGVTLPPGSGYGA